MKIIIFFSTFLLSLYSSSDSLISGEWGVYCGSSSKIYEKKSHSAMVLVDGHTYIYTRYKQLGDGVVEIYYKEVIEGGLPGKDVPWSELSLEFPIGLYRKVSPKKATLDWFGFQTNSGVKIDVLSDFLTDKQNDLERCR